MYLDICGAGKFRLPTPLPANRIPEILTFKREPPWAVSQHQQVISAKGLRRLPGVAFLVGAADGHVVERTFVGVVLPDCSLNTSSSESLDGLCFVCHESFSFK